MIYYSSKVEEELNRWNCKLANSVEVAKSFTNEGPEGDQQQQQQQEGATDFDPFKDLDVDNLPEEVRNSITKAREGIASLQKTQTQIATEKDQALQQARQFQSKADSFQSKLSKHGLLDDGRQGPPAQTASEKFAAELAVEFVAEGMTEQQAALFAKMHSKAILKARPDILREVGEAVGPHLQNVGVMSVDRMMTSAANSEQYAGVLEDESIFNSARETVMTLVQNGSAVTKDILETAIKIAVGEAAMKNPSSANDQMFTPRQQPRQVSGGTRFGGAVGLHGAGSNRQATLGGNGGPVAKNAETARAAELVAKAMSMGMKKK